MPDLDDDEEFSELHSAQFSRVDLVGAPANGSTSFLVMKQDAESPACSTPVSSAT